MMGDKQRNDLLKKVEKYYKMGNIDLDTFLPLVVLIKGTEKKRGPYDQFLDEYRLFMTGDVKRRSIVRLKDRLYRLEEVQEENLEADETVQEFADDVVWPEPTIEQAKDRIAILNSFGEWKQKMLRDGYDNEDICFVAHMQGRGYWLTK